MLEGATFPAPREHYWETVEGGFWFRPAYEKLLDELSTTPSVWVEVGVFHGQSLTYLGIEVLNRGLPVTIHAVDNFAGWPGVTQGQALRDSFDANTAPLQIALGERFQVHALPSTEAATLFADRSCDVVWLDADHTEKAVTADIQAWLPKVKLGGWIGGDDWAFGGVRKAVSHAFPDGYFLGDGDRLNAPWPYWMVKVS